MLPMNGILGNMMYPYPQLINPTIDPFGMPTTYQGLTSFVSSLQSVIANQQALINALIAKTNAQEQSTTSTNEASSVTSVKEEPEISPISQQEGCGLVDSLSEVTEECISDCKDLASENKTPGIRRRNGFKNSEILADTKVEEEGDCDSLSGRGSPSKAAAHHKSKNSSKAKHLWVNYGRRILEYAVSQTKGSMQDKIKRLIGKLNSKKDFERTFKIVESDSSDDKLFKTLLGRLAIYFVKHKASPTFETSKYKHEMITQRHTVAAWVERLISS